MVAKFKRLKRGFTLVELMIVVAIIGILAALAIYGVNRYVKNSKSAEAKEMLGRIAKDAVGAFDRENMAGAVLSAGAAASVNHRLCESSSLTPAAIPAASKYQTSPAEWGGSASAGWRCLQFSVTGPQYFQYHYLATGGAFSAIANGDLDGDAVASQFRLEGVVRTDDGKEVATFAPNFIEVNPDE